MFRQKATYQVTPKIHSSKKLFYKTKKMYNRKIVYNIHSTLFIHVTQDKSQQSNVTLSLS